MRLKAITEDRKAYVEASAEERDALVDFLRKSNVTRQIYLTKRFEDLERIAQEIVRQRDFVDDLVLDEVDFSDLVGVGTAWKWRAFDLLIPEADVEVPKSLVDTLCVMFDDYISLFK